MYEVQCSVFVLLNFLHVFFQVKKLVWFLKLISLQLIQFLTQFLYLRQILVWAYDVFQVLQKSRRIRVEADRLHDCDLFDFSLQNHEPVFVQVDFVF